MLFVALTVMNFIPLIFLAIAVHAGSSNGPDFLYSETLGFIKIEDKIGQGSFGAGYRVNWYGRKVAMKIEFNKISLLGVVDGCVPEDYGSIEHEYRRLSMMEGTKGFPKLYGSDFSGPHKIYLMELLGESIDQFANSQEGRVLNRNQAAVIATQILDRLEAMHSKGYLMHDVHLSNFLLHQNLVYAIDLSLAFPFIDSNGNHYSEKRCQLPSFPKNEKWTCRRDDFDRALSRRDELERFLYLVIKMTVGYLPW